MQFVRHIFWICLLALNSACVFSNNVGVCQSSTGGAVTTYSPYGTWKKIYGYEPPRTELDLQENFDVLVVLRTGETCTIPVVNGAATTDVTSYNRFSNDVTNKILTIQSFSDSTSNRLVQYAFSGSCGDTKMTWVGDDDVTEIFKLRTVSTEGAACSTPTE